MRIRRIFLSLALTAAAAAASATSPSPRAGAASHWVRVDVPRAALQRALGGVVASDYGRFQWLAVDPDQLARLRAAGLPVTVADAPFVLDLGGLRFDPLLTPPAPPAGWDRLAASRDEDKDLRLVQYAGPVRQSALDQLRAGGIEPLQYIPPFTYVVWGSRGSLVRAAARSAARWSGDFMPAYRVLPSWRALGSEAIDARATIYRGAVDVEAALRAAGAQIVGTRAIDRHFASIRLRAAGTSFAQMAAVAGVYSLQPVPKNGGLRGEMSDQVNAGNVDDDHFAFPGYLGYLQDIGVDGSGVIVADVDGGIFDTHPDLVHRMLPCSGDTCGGSATDAHGTHTAGIIAADGSSGVMTSNGFLRGLGMAPGANLIEQVYDPTFTQAGGMLKLMTDSVANHAVMSGNSWGPAGVPLGYDDDTRQVDVGVRDADPDTAGDQPLHYVLSFMNGDGGTSSQGTPDEGKNLFTIGSTWLQDSPTAQNPDIDDLSSNTAHGPALDGRSIPAMVAPGCDVDSSASATGYALMCGTSMASPHVTGASALFVQYYRARFGRDPSPALIKAAFTAVAKNLTGHLDADGHVMTHVFDSKQGWGRMQIDPVLAPPQSVQYVDQTTVFDNTGETWTHGYQADDPSQPIRIMLVWTDAPGHGLGGSTPAWNNDLDLRVVAGGTTYLGNALDDDGWSSTGGTADAKNNTEAVFLQPAQHGGAVEIEVLAADIDSDGLPNGGDDTDQDFALVCYNCRDADEADMSISATAAPNPVAPGQTLAYTIHAADAGPAAASAVKVSLALPEGTTFEQSAGDGWTCTLRRDIVGCDYAAALSSGGEATPLTIGTLVGARAAGTLTATISIDANGTDANAANNAVEIVTEVLDRLFTDGFEQVQTP